MTDHDADARRALNRLQRALEKTRRELDALRDASLRGAPDDVSMDTYAAADAALARIDDLIAEEGGRLRERLLRGAGMDPSRLRRPGGR